MSIPTFNSTVKVDDDDDIELLEVRHKRWTRETVSEPCLSVALPESQNQAAPSPDRSSGESLDPTQLKTLPSNNTKENTNTTSKLSPDDEIMADNVIDLTEKDQVKLPSLHQLLPSPDRTPEPEENIDQPDYNRWAHCKGFVAWWDNRTGKGLIVNYRCGLEHKVELKDISSSNYGALIPGSMVEYEYSDERFNNRFSKFWVVSGCEYVL